jgi:hypothetical protein
MGCEYRLTLARILIATIFCIILLGCERKGFHHNLANSVCSRWGEVERKQQSNAGNRVSADQEASLRENLSRGSFGDKNGSNNVSRDNSSTASRPSQNAAKCMEQRVPLQEQSHEPQQTIVVGHDCDSASAELADGLVVVAPDDSTFGKAAITTTM